MRVYSVQMELTDQNDRVKRKTVLSINGFVGDKQIFEENCTWIYMSFFTFYRRQSWNWHSHLLCLVYSFLLARCVR